MDHPWYMCVHIHPVEFHVTKRNLQYLPPLYMFCLDTPEAILACASLAYGKDKYMRMCVVYVVSLWLIQSVLGPSLFSQTRRMFVRFVCEGDSQEETRVWFHSMRREEKCLFRTRTPFLRVNTHTLLACGKT